MVITAMTSAATMDIQMPSSLHNSGNSSTAPTWNTSVRRKAMMAEVSPSFRAVKKDEP